MSFDDPRTDDYVTQCQQGAITLEQLREKLTAFAADNPERLAYLRQKYAWVWQDGTVDFI